MSWGLSRWDIGPMSEPEPRCRRAGAGLATGFVWNGSLPVEPVGVVLGHHTLPSAGVRLDAGRIPK